MDEGPTSVDVDATAGVDSGIEQGASASLADIVESSWVTDGGESSTESTPRSDTYKVKVDGEELEVGLDELLNGYSRTADYTRKTQALAEERERFTAYQRLEESLQHSPESTLQALADAYGIDLGGKQTLIDQDPFDGLDQEFVDPLEKEIAELRQWRNSIEQERAAAMEAQRLAAVDAEIETVRQRFGATDLNEAELLTFALQHQIGDLEMAYRSMKALEAERNSVREQERVIEEKRNLPPVEGGSSRSTTGVKAGTSDRMSLAAALEAALSDY